MSQSNTHLALLAVVSALLVLGAAKRAKKPPLLTDLKDSATHAGAGGVTADSEFDIVIVGGGTAGCVLAARLSEEPSLRVLLVESGESSAPLKESTIPAAFSKLFKTKHDYGLHTVAQPSAGGTSRYWPRARLLGGCTAINAMMLHHCAPSDYDEWPTFMGKTKEDSTWSYNGLKKYFLKFETFVPHKDHPDVDVSQRGSSGPMKTGYFGHSSYISQQFMRACETAGIPAIPDVNTSKGTLGVTKPSLSSRLSLRVIELTPH
jgi:choline dehydrogenase